MKNKIVKGLGSQSYQLTELTIPNDDISPVL